jgi:hypothetical protein
MKVQKDGFDGHYIGQFDIKGMFSGRGVILQKRSLYEGYFKHGKKFGPGREVKLSFGSPYLKVIEGVYDDGGVANGLFTETHIPTTADALAKKVVRTYRYANGVVKEEKDVVITHQNGGTETG